MNLGKFFVLFFFFLFFSLNAFAAYHVEMENVSITTVANPFPTSYGGLNGFTPIGQNAYWGTLPLPVTLERSDPPYPPNIPPDWIEFRFTLRNLSTNDSGEDLPLAGFSMRIDLDYRMNENLPGFNFQFDDPSSSGAVGSADGWFLVIDHPVAPSFAYNGTKEFAFRFPLNEIRNRTGTNEIRAIGSTIDFGGGNSELIQLSTGGYPQIRIHDPLYVPPPPAPYDLDIYVDPLTCIDPLTGNPVIGFPLNQTGERNYPGYDPIRCDSIDSNTIYYQLIFEDMNAWHNLVNGYHLKINYFNFTCDNGIHPILGGSRTKHYQDGYFNVGTGEGIQYIDYPPTCNFLHYASNQSGHTDCMVSPASRFPEYSFPPGYAAIANCPAGNSCPAQDQNVYYNTTYFTFRKYLNPDEFTLQSGILNRKYFQGTITNAATGGNFLCRLTGIDYTLFNGSGTPLATRALNAVRVVYDGSNTGAADGAGNYFYRLIKLDGHDAFVIKNGTFMPSSPYVRPLKPWTVELPIRNNGIPWDGATEKDVLYVDVNVISDSWNVSGQTITIGGASSDYSLLDTDVDQLFIVSFPILNEGLYHQFLTASAMFVKLYDKNQWIFDLTPESAISNLRLITILAPEVYEILGDSCFTDPNWDILCWWNYLPYRLSPVDLNANSDIDFILRQRNPFDVNEFFDLTHYTNAPTNARLEFNPQRNFVPSFTSGTFGYRYSVMTLKNPRWIRSDTNYQVVTTSVNYPYVWDDLKVEFKNFSHNLKIESFTVSPQRDQYSLGEELDFRLDINNTGNIAERDINFLVVSSMDPSIRFYAPAGLDWPGGVNIINPGQIITFVGTLPAIPSKNVFVIEATVNSVPFEATTADNSEKIVITTEYSGNVSALPETNYFFVAFIVFFVLFVVIKK
ncbi:MAG: hypothetical protein ABH986_06720 [archaeon]